MMANGTRQDTSIGDYLDNHIKSDLSNIADIHSELKDRENGYQQELLLLGDIDSCKHNSSQSDITSILIDSIDKIEFEINEFEKKLRANQNLAFKHIPQEIRNKMVEITSLHIIEKYLSLYSQLKTTSLILEQCKNKRNTDRAMDTYCELENLNSQICNNELQWLQLSANQCIEYWIEELWNLFKQEVKNSLKSLNFPFTLEEIDFKQEQIIHLAKHYKYLLNIYQSYELKKSKLSFILEKPIKILVESLKKRFDFHFLGTKESNKLTKPEWFFSQLIKWVNINYKTLDTLMQPLLPSNHPILMEFVHELCSWAVNKVEMDFHEMELLYEGSALYNKMFAHWIDQIIIFEEDLRDMGIYIHDYKHNNNNNNNNNNNLNYESDKNRHISVLEILKQEKYFSKLLFLEQAIIKKIRVKLLTILDEDLYKTPADLNEIQLPNWSLQLMLEVRGLQHRAECINFHTYQIQIVYLQHTCLLDFAEEIQSRMSRLELSEDDIALIMIQMNGVEYCLRTVEKLQDEPIYIKIMSQSLAGNTSCNSIETSLFDDVITNYKGLFTQMQSNLILNLYAYLEANAYDYVNFDWSKNGKSKDEDLFYTDTNKALVKLITAVKWIYNCIFQYLSPQQAIYIWLNIINQLDECIFNKLFTKSQNEIQTLIFQLDSYFLPLVHSLDKCDEQLIFCRLRDVSYIFKKSETECVKMLRELNESSEVLSKYKKRSSLGRYYIESIDVCTRYNITHLEKSNVIFLLKEKLKYFS